MLIRPLGGSYRSLGRLVFRGNSRTLGRSGVIVNVAANNLLDTGILGFKVS